MSALVVGIATDEDAASWDGYVDAHPQASIFHRFVWRSVLAEGLGYRSEYLMARRDGQVCAILPLMRVRSRWHGTTFVSLPFCAYGGPLADDAEALLAVDRQAQTLAQACGAKFVEYRFEAGSPLQAPTLDLYQTFIKAVPDNIEELAAVPQKRRSLLRKAMAAGLPCVTTDVPGCREAVRNGDNGMLVPPGNAGALADALEELLRDPESARKMGLRGRQRVEEEFSADQVNESTLALYREMLMR